MILQHAIFVEKSQCCELSGEWFNITNSLNNMPYLLRNHNVASSLVNGLTLLIY